MNEDNIILHSSNFTVVSFRNQTLALRLKKLDLIIATPKFFKDWGYGYIAVRHKGLEQIKRLNH